MHRRTDALLLIAVYEFVTAAILLLISCVVLPILLIVTPFVSDGFGAFVLQFVWVGLVLLAVFGLAIASIIVGIGILARREWARVGAMALAVPALFGFPIWTVAGILIIWYLAGDEARPAFRGKSWSERFFFSTARAEPPSTPPAAASPPLHIGSKMTSASADQTEMTDEWSASARTTVSGPAPPEAPLDAAAPDVPIGVAESLPLHSEESPAPPQPSADLPPAASDAADRPPSDAAGPEKPRPS